MTEWTLRKPERELYQLVQRLRLTAAAIETFMVTGEKAGQVQKYAFKSSFVSLAYGLSAQFLVKKPEYPEI